MGLLVTPQDMFWSVLVLVPMQKTSTWTSRIYRLEIGLSAPPDNGWVASQLNNSWICGGCIYHRYRCWIVNQLITGALLLGGPVSDPDFQKKYQNCLVVWNIWMIFPYTGNFIIPTDELIFFRGVGWNHQPVMMVVVVHTVNCHYHNTTCCFFQVIIMSL